MIQKKLNFNTRISLNDDNYIKVNAKDYVISELPLGFFINIIFLIQVSIQCI